MVGMRSLEEILQMGFVRAVEELYNECSDSCEFYMKYTDTNIYERCKNKKGMTWVPNEESFRLALYHHMRELMKDEKYKSFKIVGDFILDELQTKKPDLIIFGGSLPLIYVEIKFFPKDQKRVSEMIFTN